MRLAVGRGSLWAALLVISAACLRYHFDLCRFPYEVLPSEAGMAQSARAMRQGLDPWSPSIAPQSFNDYGCLTPALAAAVSAAWPAVDPLQGLRWLSALALGLGAWMLFARLRREGCDSLVGAAAALSFYAGMLFFEGASAKPDAVAIALYIAALMLGTAGDRRLAFVAGAVAALAFFAKSYAVLAGPLVIAGLWVTGRRSEAKAMALSLSGVGLALLFVVWRRFPLYYWGTIPVVANTVGYSFTVLWVQCLTLAKLHLPLLLGFLALGWMARRQGRWSSPAGPAALWAGLAAAVFVVLAAGPGAHAGAFLIYYLQLFYPPLILATVLWAQQWRPGAGALALVLVLDVAAVLGLGSSLYPGDADALAKGWPQAAEMVRANKHGFYPPIMTTLLVKEGAFIADTDHTHTLHLAGYGSYHSPLAEAAVAHFRAIGEGLHQGSFSVAVCGAYWPCPGGAMRQSYRLVGQLCLGSPIQAAPCFDVFVPVHPNPKEHP